MKKSFKYILSLLILIPVSSFASFNVIFMDSNESGTITYKTCTETKVPTPTSNPIIGGCSREKSADFTTRVMILEEPATVDSIQITKISLKERSITGYGMPKDVISSSATYDNIENCVVSSHKKNIFITFKEGKAFCW